MSGLRIIGGAWRGRALVTPVGLATRPTSGRVRQALFDMLRHAAWAERAIEGRAVLDVFAGSGALGLEALSRGAASATFIEWDRVAGEALRRNIVLCRAEDRARLVACDARLPPRGRPHKLILLDPPYGQDLIPAALAALGPAGWIERDALIVGEFGGADTVPAGLDAVATRAHGAARIVVWRAGSSYEEGMGPC